MVEFSGRFLEKKGCYMKQKKTSKFIAFLAIILIVLVTIGVVGGTRYNNNRLLISNESVAVDMARLIRNNFQITDAEVEHMKSVSFNEMETDPINMRLMNVINGTELESNIVNVYVISKLEQNEIKYYTDASNAEDFECDEGTPLNGIWLLNGKFDDKGCFLAAQRDDIYRYTDITSECEAGLESKNEFGTYSSDEWGNFITGYVPIYTVEGNFVGLLGVDIDPDKFQKGVREFTPVLILILGLTVMIMTVLFLVFYFRYNKARESKIYFDFYSKMSHDMRTPMNGIIGMVNLAKEEKDTDILHNYFAKVGESGEYLLSLINDTLDEGKIASGKMTLNNCDVVLSQMIEKIKDIIIASANKKKIDFKVESDVEESVCVKVDAVRFEQIFINLLSNAVKFTNEGGHVELRIKTVSVNDDYYDYEFTVSDNGIGMSEEFIKKSLFKPFSQESNTVSNTNMGSGLGLVITKNIVRLMGGTINVTSELNKGTTFEVKIRLIRSLLKPEDINREYDKAEHDITGVKILLCEDHPLNREISTKLLVKKGCIVDTAENGQIGVDKFVNTKEGYYDIILMDIRMPVMNGLEAARAIRELDREDAKNIPIVAMTANAYAEDVKISADAGMDAHLSKPIDPDKLYSVIENYTKKQI